MQDLQLKDIGVTEIKCFGGPFEDDVYFFIPSGNKGEFLIVYESAHGEYSIEKKTQEEIKQLYDIDL